VSAAITTIAEVGYRNASFAQIAKRAGLSSTGLISYHFASKAELIGEVVTTVLADLAAFMAARMEAAGMEAADNAATALRAYIEGTIDFIDTHREPMKALTEVFVNGAFGYDADSERAAISPLEEILRSGQAAGEFRPVRHHPAPAGSSRCSPSTSVRR
jgi:AcrR family transcriptional regulator